MIEKALSSQLVRAFYNVHLEHGYGFLESVYSNALAVELDFMGCTWIVKPQLPSIIGDGKWAGSA